MPSGEARAKWREVQDIGKAWGGVHCFGPMGVQTWPKFANFH
jgi:hypothetical protein